MNDGQLTRYAAIEARLPEGFPRPIDHDFEEHYKGGWWIGVCDPDGRGISDLERLGFGVLVLRAGIDWCLNGQSGRRRVSMGTRCQTELAFGNDPAALSDLLSALESAYPEGAKP